MRATRGNTPSSGQHVAPSHRSYPRRNRCILHATALAVSLMLLLASHRPARAQENILRTKGEPFPEAIVAYRLGHSYLVKGDYQRAIDYLTRAVELIPEDISIAESAYADIYWVLGEAEERAGLYAQALAHYQQFLDLVGDKAAPWAEEKVRMLKAQLSARA